MRKLIVDMLIIDAQESFMDKLGSSLPVTGATADMYRLACLIGKYGKHITNIYMTMDSHPNMCIFNSGWWVDKEGNNPPPLTIILYEDVLTGVWKTSNPANQLRSLDYVQTLKVEGKQPLTIWPEHCIVDTPGHDVDSTLAKSISEWEQKFSGKIDIVHKGTNPFTEHYGALVSEKPDPNDPSTQLNTVLLKKLLNSDMLLVAGEALSHCVMETVNQIIVNVPEKFLKRIHILTDCTSPVGYYPGGKDYPTISRKWLDDIQEKGIVLTTSDKVLT